MSMVGTSPDPQLSIGIPANVRAKFVDFVKNGGGFVSDRAADNAFAEWEASGKVDSTGPENG